MSGRPLPAQSGSLTSLLDVMFLLMFAALINAGARAPDEAEAAPPPTASPSASAPAADAGAPDAGKKPSPAFDAARRRALDDLARAAQSRAAVVARVSADGVLRALDRGGDVVQLGTPLVERVPDPDVALAYLGDRSAELRVCAIVARSLSVSDLRDHLVVVVPDAPLADLPIGLVEGLRRDAVRCLEEQRGFAVLVDPASVEGETP
jgi:hypothetical protein